MHNNLKFQDFLDKWRMIGYGVWIVCLELVAAHADVKKKRFSLTKKRNWKKRLKKIAFISEKTLDAILQDLAEYNLISKKSLQLGSLSIPKMRDWMDNYSDRVQREYIQDTKNGQQRNSTVQNITKQYNATGKPFPK